MDVWKSGVSLMSKRRNMQKKKVRGDFALVFMSGVVFYFGAAGDETVPEFGDLGIVCNFDTSSWCMFWSLGIRRRFLVEITSNVYFIGIYMGLMAGAGSC